jgi:hypothetical protein
MAQPLELGLSMLTYEQLMNEKNKGTLDRDDDDEGNEGDQMQTAH